MKKNKYLTFASLFEVKRSDPKTGKAKAIKADRNILQCLIDAYDAGRTVNLNNIMYSETDLPLPAKWEKCIAHEDNNAFLA